MTIGTTKPGLSAAFLSPFTPIAYTPGGTPIFAIEGGRSGAGIDFIVDDRDDDGDPFAEREGDDDDEEDDEEDPFEEGGDDGDDEREEGDERQSSRRRSRRDRDDEDEGADWQPPSREAVRRMEEALERANRTQKDRRFVAKAMRRLGIDDERAFNDFLLDRGIDPENGGLIHGDEDSGHEAEGESFDGEREKPRRGGRSQEDVIKDMKRAEARGEARAAGKLEDVVFSYAAEAAIRAAGWQGKNLAMAMRLIDRRNLEIDTEGGEAVVSGLDEQIEQIRTEFPEWFGDEERERERRPLRPRESRRRSGAREVDGGARRREDGQPQTWAQQLDRQLMRRS